MSVALVRAAESARAGSAGWMTRARQRREELYCACELRERGRAVDEERTRRAEQRCAHVRPFQITHELHIESSAIAPALSGQAYRRVVEDARE